MRKNVKIALISTVCVLGAVGILIGALWYFGNQTEPVEVVPVSYYSSFFGGMMQYYDGSVTADNLQSVYPSDTQTVTEIFVTEGQTVKAGDPLLSYDTTLSEIQLERQRIQVQQAELDLQNAQKELQRINAMKPYVPPPVIEPPIEAPTEPLEPAEELPYFMGGSGTQELPYRWLWADGLTYDESFITSMLSGSEVWIAFEVREQNATEGALLNRWGLHVTATALEEGSHALRYAFFVPEDPPTDEEENGDAPGNVWVDNSSGYTSAEIAQMRAAKQKEIRDLDVAYRIAQVEYDRMLDEAENGVVYAKVDGTVIRLNDAETAMMEGSPILTVSGGGGLYVNVAIGEYDRETYPVGTEVTISSWMNYGMEITGTVVSISDIPTTGYYYGGGNSNVSLYTATVAVAPDAGLQEGEYVSVEFGAQTDDEVFYLDNMYLRTENGRTYVYKRGADGKLEKTYVTTGDSYWGYTAILTGLSLDDYVAFPYGNDVKDGAETVEGENIFGFGGIF